MNPAPDRLDWREVLGRYPAEFRPIGAVESLGNAGGFSGSRFWRFESGAGRMGLRACPAEGPGVDLDLGRIHGWIARAGTLPFVPVPIPASDGRTIQEGSGRRWDLSPWMPGSPDLDRPPSPAHIAASFDGLARFHGCFNLGRASTSPGLASRITELWRWIGQDLADVRGRLHPVGADPISDATRVWLDEAGRRARGLADFILAEGAAMVPIRPCLRDARPDHFLFEGDRLAGLVDFGAMGPDTIACDLARLLAESIGADRVAREVALAAYRSIRPIGDDEARLIPVFEAANALLGAGRWVRWHFLEGRRFDEPGAVLDGLRRGLRRLEEFDRGPRPFRS